MSWKSGNNVKLVGRKLVRGKFVAGSCAKKMRRKFVHVQSSHKFTLHLLLIGGSRSVRQVWKARVACG